MNAVDAGGRTALRLALLLGATDLVQALLDAKADCTGEPVESQTLAHDLARGGVGFGAHGAAPVLMALAERLAADQPDDRGRLPLHYAAALGRSALCSVLRAACNRTSGVMQRHRRQVVLRLSSKRLRAIGRPTTKRVPAARTRRSRRCDSRG